MAKRKPAVVEGSQAEILNEGPDLDAEEGQEQDKYQPLVEWVLERVNSFTAWRDSNYSAKWDEWERLWRGIFNESERLRQTERSTIVNPALSEAVENAAAELEEAVFGRGADYFDLGSPEKEVEQPAPAPMPQAIAGAFPMAPQPAGAPPMPMPGMAGVSPANPFEGLSATVDPAAELDKVRSRLKEDLAHTDFAAETVKAILYAAVFGSGFGEIVLEDIALRQPSVGPGGLVVSDTKKYTCGKLRALNPRNCAWDPNAETLEKGLGFAVIEKVSKHLVIQSQKSGEFRKDIDLCEAPPADANDLHVDKEGGDSEYDSFNAKQIKWFGLVPKSLLFPKDGEAPEAVDGDDELIDADDDEFVEAFVVIINDHVCAKAKRNPFAQQDRPIVHFPWDIVPGRLLGRGICEKGAAPQKILDTEVRARLDSLALITAPMMGMDVNRLPRGFKFKIQPGGSVLTNGRPSEVMEPFKFGQLDPNHWQNAADLKGMVQSATGSVDGAALAQGAGDARSGAMSMAMAPIIKRYKRTLVHFLDEFLMPAVEKILWRNMQFNKARYPAVPFTLRAASTMGIMQREYETQQMTQLLSGLQPGTPEHRAVLAGVVANTSIPNREQVMKMIEGAEERAAAEAAAVQAASEDPMVAQLKQVTIQLEIAEKQAKIRKLNAEASVKEIEAEMKPAEVQIDAMATATKGMYSVPEDSQAAEFDRRMAIADRVLEDEKLAEKRADRASNERIVDKQIQANLAATAMKEDNKARLAARKPTNQ